MIKCRGYINNRFKSVKDIFISNFNNNGEIGASFCVYHKNELMVDIWGGTKDIKNKTSWEGDTVVPIFSTTKAIAAVCLAILHSKGLFKYEDKISKFWKEFSVNGKEDITISELLEHRAGLSAIDVKLTKEIIDNEIKLDELLANQKPHWKVNEYQGYHVWTIGWYISALISRIDPQNRRLKYFFEQEVLPKIDGEIRIGINEDYDHKKIANLEPFSKIRALTTMPFIFVLQFFNPWSLTYKSMLNPSFLSNHSNMNKKEILQLEIGSGGGIANARGLASIMNVVTNPESDLFLGNQTLERLFQYPTQPKNGFKDIVFKQHSFIFSCGLMKPSKKHNFSSSKKSFGGFGAGGSFVSFDPENELIMAYTMNKMSEEMMNMQREIKLRESVLRILNIEL